MTDWQVGEDEQRFRLFDPACIEAGPITEILVDPQPAVGRNHDEHGLRVTIVGELSGYTAAQLTADLLPIAPLADPLFIDLSLVTTFDGGGARLLEALRDDLRSRGSDLIVEAPSQRMDGWLAGSPPDTAG